VAVFVREPGTSGKAARGAGEFNTRYIYLISGVAAVGGLLFGYDTAVINGGIVFLKAHFQLTQFQTEIAASSLLLGCILGAGAAGFLSDRLGRKRILMLAAVLFLLSAVGAALPRTLSEFIVARFLGGVAIGIASLLSPLYIAEIAPADIRGRLVTLNQMAIVTGILCSYVVNWSLADIGVNNWRWMFAVAGLPSFLFLLALFAVPESPRWLIKQGRYKEGLSVLSRICGNQEAGRQAEEIKTSLEDEKGSWRLLFSALLRRPLLIAVVLAILQQITGINTILYYGSLIMTEQAGQQSANVALAANVVIGIVNLLATIVALVIIDRVGRKALLLVASAGMGLSLGILGIVFHYWQAPGLLVLVPILAYVACFGVGMGAVVWVLMSELFPTKVRGRAMSVATVSLWVACFLITLTFLSLVEAITAAGAFWLYASMCVVTFFFVWHFCPETKGKTLEQIERGWLK
jgi:sugar porter (SP) family MFS transporter